MIMRSNADRGAGFAASVASYFDDLAPRWSSNYLPQGSMAERIARFETALALAGVGANARVLDFGCGSGTISGALAGKGYIVTGCDISQQMISVAQSTYPIPGIRWVVLNPFEVELPFTPGEYDAVIASSVLEYIPCPSPVLAQFRRILVPGGSLICTVPDERHPVRVAERNWLISAQRPLARCALRYLPRFVPYRRRFDYLCLSLTRWTIQEWQEAFSHQGFTPPVVGDCTDPLLVLSTQSTNHD